MNIFAPTKAIKMLLNIVNGRESFINCVKFAVACEKVENCKNWQKGAHGSLNKTTKFMSFCSALSWLWIHILYNDHNLNEQDFLCKAH